MGREGPFLTPGQRDWIAQLRARPLRLYRGTDVQPGAGMTLIDELDPQAQPQSVREISGSRSARPGMLVGARIMDVATGAGIDGHRELSGAIYPFYKLAEAAVLAQARQVLAGSQRDLLELEIARARLDQWFAPAPLPQIQDASTGDPLLLVTDHYRVLDAAALAASLASQPDVSGDAQQGWHRMIEGADGAQRSLSAINPERSTNRVELFHRMDIETRTSLPLIGPDADEQADEDPRDDDRWLFIEPIESSEAFHVIGDFVDQCGDDRIARALGQALRQRKPFRRFKDVLAAHPAQREAWFAFERQAMESIARRWCEDHGISPR